MDRVAAGATPEDEDAVAAVSERFEPVDDELDFAHVVLSRVQRVVDVGVVVERPLHGSSFARADISLRGVTGPAASRGPR